MAEPRGAPPASAAAALMAAAVRAAVQAHAPHRTVPVIARWVASPSLFSIVSLLEAGAGEVDGDKDKHFGTWDHGGGTDRTTRLFSGSFHTRSWRPRFLRSQAATAPRPRSGSHKWTGQGY